MLSRVRLYNPMGYSPPGSSSPGELPQPGIEPVFPALTGRFFTTEPLVKPSYKRARTHTHTHTHTLSDSFSGEAPVTYTHRHVDNTQFQTLFLGKPQLHTYRGTHACTHTHSQILFPYRLLQDTEFSVLLSLDNTWHSGALL